VTLSKTCRHVKSWSGEEQVRLTPPGLQDLQAAEELGGQESCLLSVSACLKQAHFCGIFWFQVVFLTGKTPRVKLCDERSCVVLTQP